MILGYTYTSKFSKASVYHSLSLLMFKLKPYFVICALAETFAGVNVACKMYKEQNWGEQFAKCKRLL